MDSVGNNFLQSRGHAGRLLGAKLRAYKNSGAVVVGIPRGGALVAAALSEELQLPFDVMPCRKIKHPGNGTRSIGSVSVQEIVLNPFAHDLPQDYIGHQIAMIRNSLQADDRFYHEEAAPLSLKGKIVILVDESLRTADSVMACLVNVKKQMPFKVIVAVSVATQEVAAAIGRVADEVVFLYTEEDLRHPSFREFTAAKACDVKALLMKLRRTEAFAMV
ncbi:MAG TPA: phosphoribosyltransferase family protein [Chryseolinea sp.]